MTIAATIFALALAVTVISAALYETGATHDSPAITKTLNALTVAGAVVAVAALAVFAGAVMA